MPVPAKPEALVVRAQQLGLSASSMAIVRKMFGGNGSGLVLQLSDDDDEIDMSGLLTPACVREIRENYRRSEPFGDPRATHATHSRDLLVFDEVDFMPAMRAAVKAALASVSLAEIVREQVAMRLRMSRGSAD